jgi:hypothetical protein
VSDVRKEEIAFKFSIVFNSPLNSKEVVENVLGLKHVLSNEIEGSLFNYCIDMDAAYYGLSAADVRHVAYQLAICNGLRHPFSHCGPKKTARKFSSKYANVVLYHHWAYCYRII